MVFLLVLHVFVHCLSSSSVFLLFHVFITHLFVSSTSLKLPLSSSITSSRSHFSSSTALVLFLYFYTHIASLLFHPSPCFLVTRDSQKVSSHLSHKSMRVPDSTKSVPICRIIIGLLQETNEWRFFFSFLRPYFDSLD